MRKTILAVMLSALLVPLIAACGSDPTATPTARPVAAKATPTPVPSLEQQLYEEAKATAGGEIHLLFPMTADDAVIIFDFFEAKYPGLDIIHTQKSTSEVTEQTLLEHQNKRVSVDVVDPGRDSRVIDSGVLANSKDIFDDIKLNPLVRYGDNKAALYTPLGHGPMYNTDLVSEADVPKSWKDLLDPKWKDQIVLEDRLKGYIYMTDVPAYNGKYPNLWSEAEVIEYLTALRGQNPLIVHGNTTVGNTVASGERAIAGEINMSSAGRLVKKGAPVGIAPVTPHSVEQWLIAATKSGPNPAGGKLLLRWIIGSEGIAERTKFYPGTSVDPASGDIVALEYEKKGIELAYSGIEIASQFSRLQKVYREAIGFVSN